MKGFDPVSWSIQEGRCILSLLEYGMCVFLVRTLLYSLFTKIHSRGKVQTFVS